MLTHQYVFPLLLVEKKFFFEKTERKLTVLVVQ